MTNGVPELEINQILTELSTLLDHDNTDTLQLRRIEMSVERLWQKRAVSAVDYYTSKAFIEFGKYRRGAALEAANNVLKLAPFDPVAQCNALSLQVAALEVDSAIPLLKRMAAEVSDDKDTLYTLIIKAADLLQYGLAMELYSVLDKLCINDAPAQYVRRPSIERGYAAMKRTNFTDADAAARLKAAHSALRDQSFDVWRNSRSVLLDGSVLYFLHVKADAEQCAVLNFSIAERLVEQFEDPGAEFVSFSCRPLTDLSELTGLPAGVV